MSERKCDGYRYTIGNSEEVRDGVSPLMSEDRTRNNGHSVWLDSKVTTKKAQYPSGLFVVCDV